MGLVTVTKVFEHSTALKTDYVMANTEPPCRKHKANAERDCSVTWWHLHQGSSSGAIVSLPALQDFGLNNASSLLNLFSHC